jgi:hypothetical protein
MGEWKYSSIILRFTIQPLYLRRKGTRYRLNRRLGEPQSRPERYEEQKNLAPIGNRNRAVQRIVRRYTD